MCFSYIIVNRFCDILGGELLLLYSIVLPLLQDLHTEGYLDQVTSKLNFCDAEIRVSMSV